MSLLNPYAILIAIMTVALFFMHGSIYILMKTEGELHDKMGSSLAPSIIFFVITYATATMATLIYMPHMIEAIQERPFFFVIAICNMLAIANIPREIQRGRDGWAFISSCANIVFLMML